MAAAGLRVGASSININPPMGLRKGGFRLFGEPISSVDDDIELGVAVVQSGGTTVAVIVCDLENATVAEANEFRDLVAGVVGVPRSHVLFNVSHNHSAPTMSGNNGQPLPAEDRERTEAYQRGVLEKLSECTAAALQSMREARMGVGWGSADLNVYRREFQGAQDVLGEVLERPVDDSVVRVIAGRPAMMRLGRGYAPLPLPLSSSPSPSSRIALPLAVSGEEARRAGEPVPAIVALGGDQKAALAAFNGDQAVLGPHIGDLDGEASRRRYLEQLRAWLALYGGPVSVVAHDAHPDYWTTRLAENWRDFDGQLAGTPPPLRLIPVQHHHAHVVAAMVEHRLLSTEVLGVAWDGTGWGPDGTIWGGEFLVANSSRYRRVARLRPFALPGGERAVRQPWRTAVSLLAQAWDDPLAAAAWMGARAVREPAAAAAPDAWAAAIAGASATAADAAADTTGSPALVSLEARNLEACARLATARPRSPLAPWTSSVGRLFDGLAAMILPDARRPMSYEGQAAAWLEAVAQGETAVGQDYQDYAMEWGESVDSPPLWELDWRPLVRAVARDVERGQPAAALAAAFHSALADAIEWVADRHADLPVVLGGGVFQNRLLVETTAARFASRGRWLGTPGMIPVNDGGLAAGQLAVAMAVAAT